jgi:hypothetical protein
MDYSKIRTALGLLNSMVEGGEQHTEQSKAVVSEAYAELNKFSTRAKFQCHSITPGYNADQKTVWMTAVYGTEGENADFAKATPSGVFQMTVDKDTAAFDSFARGANYYLDITEAPAK